MSILIISSNIFNYPTKTIPVSITKTTTTFEEHCLN